MEDDLSCFLPRCRCCLEDTKGDTYLKITNFIEERFFEFTEMNVNKQRKILRSLSNDVLSQLVRSEKLSTKICITCNSLLARYSAIRKTFVENQRVLKRLLYKEPAGSESPETSKEEVILPGGYTVIEPLDETLHIEVPKLDPPIKQPKTKTSKIHQCDECSFQVKNHPETLRNHKWKVHGGPRPERKVLVCEFCSKEFSKGELLKRHLATHSNLKKFSCGEKY